MWESMKIIQDIKCLPIVRYNSSLYRVVAKRGSSNRPDKIENHCLHYDLHRVDCAWGRPTLRDIPAHCCVEIPPEPEIEPAFTGITHVATSMGACMPIRHLELVKQ